MKFSWALLLQMLASVRAMLPGLARGTSLQQLSMQAPALTPMPRELSKDAATFDERAREKLWAEHWWPLVFLDQTSKERPTPLHLLGAPLVVWWDPSQGEWHCTVDRCPHRFAKLSEGRVDEHGRIECPYHGWAFEGKTGACTSIPQEDHGGQHKSTNSQRACVTRLPVVIRQGMLWAWAGPLYPGANPFPIGEPHTVDEAKDPDYSVLDYWRDCAIDTTLAAENFLDPSHTFFAHHKTIADRGKAHPVPLRLSGPINPEGFVLSGTSSDWPGTATFKAPDLALVANRRDDTYSTVIANYCVPTLPGHCRQMTRIMFETKRMPPPLNYIIKASFSKPLTWLAHITQAPAVIEDDHSLLHDVEHFYRQPGSSQVVPAWKSRLYLPTRSDGPFIAFRRWVDDYTDGEGVSWSPFTPASALATPAAMVPSSALLDRYESHAEHCTACRKALDVARKMQMAGKVIVALSLALQVLPPAGIGVLVIWLAAEVEQRIRTGPAPSERRDS